MKNIEILERDRNQPKLTIAVDRVTIKLPINMSKDKRESVSKQLIEISNQYVDYPYTLRGALTKFNTLRLSHGRVEKVYVGSHTII